MKKLLLPLTFICVLFSNCSNKDNDPAVNIKGFMLTDGVGNPYGSNGNIADDWKLSDWSSLSPLEQSFLSFSDNITITNGTVSTVYEPAPYPNPFNNLSRLAIHSDDEVKFKIAVVDASGTIIKTDAMILDGYGTWQGDFSDYGTESTKKSFRYYYSFSVNGHPNFKVGYGDVRLCRGYNPGSEFSDCF